MSNTQQISIRLDADISKEYQKMADARGMPFSTYLREVLSNNLHTLSVKNEVDRFEDIVHDMEKNLLNAMKKFTDENKIGDRYFEDFGGLYMMLLGVLMQLQVDKEDVKKMQNRGIEYAQSRFLEKNQ